MTYYLQYYLERRIVIYYKMPINLISCWYRFANMIIVKLKHYWLIYLYNNFYIILFNILPVIRNFNCVFHFVTQYYTVNKKFTLPSLTFSIHHVSLKWKVPCILFVIWTREIRQPTVLSKYNLQETIRKSFKFNRHW